METLYYTPFLAQRAARAMPKLSEVPKWLIRLLV